MYVIYVNHRSNYSVQLSIRIRNESNFYFNLRKLYVFNQMTGQLAAIVGDLEFTSSLRIMIYLMWVNTSIPHSDPRRGSDKFVQVLTNAILWTNSGSNRTSLSCCELFQYEKMAGLNERLALSFANLVFTLPSCQSLKHTYNGICFLSIIIQHQVFLRCK